jgi:hypothetical protein
LEGSETIVVAPLLSRKYVRVVKWKRLRGSSSARALRGRKRCAARIPPVDFDGIDDFDLRGG